VLVYHRVADTATDPWKLAVSPSHFKQHLGVLRRWAHPMPLAELVELNLAGVPVPRGVAVTFDDGYADNLYHAAPLLESFQVPGTVFVTPVAALGETEFWWDELARLVLKPERVPRTLAMDIAGIQIWWESPATGHDRETRVALCRRLRDAMLGLGHPQRRVVLDRLRSWVGAPHDAYGTGRPLTEDELRTLSRSPVVEIGGHTLSHPALPSLDRDSQRQEIERGQAHIARITGSQPTSFAYPFGEFGATPEALEAILTDVGFRYACTLQPDTIRSHLQPLRIPRYMVPDVDGRRFAMLLAGWLLS
jgi:peptidoglycan/xylan/chitin deacetylase (PgdA/CDA1 family)